MYLFIYLYMYIYICVYIYIYIYCGTKHACACVYMCMCSWLTWFILDAPKKGQRLRRAEVPDDSYGDLIRSSPTILSENP